MLQRLPKLRLGPAALQFTRCEACLLPSPSVLNPCVLLVLVVLVPEFVGDCWSRQ